MPGELDEFYKNEAYNRAMNAQVKQQPVETDSLEKYREKGLL